MDRRTYDAVTVYIAGPFTQGDPLVNTHNAMSVWHHLHSYGFVPFCPHAATVLLHLHHPLSYAQWLAYCKHWVRICDVFLRLPGDSQGADDEEALALALGKPVYRDPHLLISSLERERTV